jgi:hypothetical protein
LFLIAVSWFLTRFMQTCGHKNVNFLVQVKKRWLCFLLLLSTAVLSYTVSYAQVANSRQNTPSKGDTLTGDSLRVKRDSIRRGDIETTVKYDAKDSIVYDLRSKLVYLYGNAHVNYGNIQLDAEQIQIDQNTNVVHANGIPDSTGKLLGKPKFKDGGNTFEAQAMSYNFITRKGIIREVVTNQGEGYIQGQRVKKDAEDNLYLGNAKYTTCNLAHPHFYIYAKKIKRIGDKQIVTGPFNFNLGDVPLPVGFLFGLFPQTTKSRKSGIIFPTYGEEPNGRGFFLRNGGYYWATNEYMNLVFLGEIYSRGGWGLNLSSQYLKRYHFTGNWSMRYNRRLQGEEGNQVNIDDFWVSWSHTPQSKTSGRFSASVNAGTNGFNSRNQINDPYGTTRLSASFNSNVTYSKIFTGTPFSITASIRHDMNVLTKIMNLTLPDFSLNVNRLYPLNLSNITSSGSHWWQTLNIGYTARGSNQLSNVIGGSQSFSFPIDYGSTVLNGNSLNKRDTLNFLGQFPTVLSNAQLGMQHTIPVSLTVKLLRYFSLNPSLNYTETWYPRRLDYSVNPLTGRVRVDTVNKFSRFYSYSMGASLTTRIFGTYTFSGRGRIQAIRHTIIPNIGFSYSPDFSAERYGFYQKLQLYGNDFARLTNDQRQTNPQNNGLISHYQGFFLGQPSQGSSGSISFSIANTLEAKVKPRPVSPTKDPNALPADTTAALASDPAVKKSKFEKRSLLDNLSFNTSKNLLASERRGEFSWSPVTFNLSTRFLNNKLNVNIFGGIDPYKWVLDSTINKTTLVQRRIPELFFQRKALDNPFTNRSDTAPIKASQLSSFSVALSTNLGPKKRDKTVKPIPGKVSQETAQQINQNYPDYIDWNIPWDLNISYVFSYNRQGFSPSTKSQTVNFNGNISLTQKWKVTFSSGYDFQLNSLSFTNFGINRDLHCWDMSFTWTPFPARFQSYQFNIRARASLLQDLKLTRQRTWFDR